MGFLETNELAVNQEFKTRVKIATLVAAGQLLAEPTTEDVVRMFAQIVISEVDGLNWLHSMCFQVVANPAISAESSDSDIQFTVNSNFEKVAKAFYKVA